MADRADAYRFKPRDSLTHSALNARFLDLNARVLGVEIQRRSEDEAFGVVLDRVLARSEAVIASLRDQLLAITQLQWLTATSTTPAALEEEAELFLVIEDAQRELFSPGPFAVLTRTATAEDYAVVRTLAYDRETGIWDIAVEALQMDSDPHDDWLIAAIAGSTLAQLTLLEEARVVRNATIDAAAGVAGVGAQLALVEAARDLALEYRDAAQDHKVGAQDALAAALIAKAAAEAAAASLTFATVAEVRAGTATGKAVAPATLAGAAAFITLIYGSTVAWDVANGFNARVVLTGNPTIGAPTNLKDGVPYTFHPVQDAVGGRTASWNAIWDFGEDGPPTLSTGANKEDKVVAQYNAARNKLEATFRKAG